MTEQPSPILSKNIEAQFADLRRRMPHIINRSVGQHLKCIRRAFTAAHARLLAA